MPLHNPEPRISMTAPFTAEVHPDPASASSPPVGETLPRRNILTKDELRWQPEVGVETIFDLVKRAATKFGDKNAMGSRKLIKKHAVTKKVKKVIDGKVQEVEKIWTMYEMGPYEYVGYNYHLKVVKEIGSAMRKLGLEKGDKVHLFASTSAHWIAVAHGAISQSMTIVTAYDTLGIEGLKHSLHATKAKLMFLEPHLLKTFSSTLDSATKNYVETIVYNTESEYDFSQADVDELRTAHPEIKVLSFDELRTLGQENPVEPVEPKRTDLACVMYTSGSGGSPKGVRLTHANVIAAVAGCYTQIDTTLSESDSMLSYLPLAHIFEFALEHIGFYVGFTLGYGSPRTLSDGSMMNCPGDLRELKPTILIGVPAVWETVKKGIIAKVEGGSKLLQKVFWGAYYAKTFLIKNNLPGSFVLDALVFNKVKDATGGRLRLCGTAAAPIARDTQEFLSMAIAPVISIYGLTEACGMGALCHPDTWNLNSIGAPESCCEVKLVDFPEAGYFSTNKPRQQGEIWIRGPSVMEGYWVSEEDERDGKGEKVEDWKAEGGWLMTGDIGEWDEMGMLKVIDRKKNLVKTLNGEYIALEKLEAIYRSAPVVANICIYADGTQTNPIALIVPAEPALIKLAASLGVEGHGMEDLVLSPVIQKDVLKQLQALGKKAGFSGMEIVVGVVLVGEEWTPVNGLTTPTMKLKRKALHDKYEKDIKAAFAMK